MAIFPLLKNPQTYRPCHTDLVTDAASRAHWLDEFENLISVQLDAAQTVGIAEEKRDAAETAWRAELNRIRKQPDRHGRLDILILDELRQQIMSEHGIVDEMRLLKQRENEATFPLLKGWLARLDQLEFPQRIELLMHGMLAGNLFDMGVKAMAEEFAAKSVPFETTLKRVPMRPWFCDDVEKLSKRWSEGGASRWKKTVVFADNAGADVTLGLLPLVRELLRSGLEVVVTANAGATWNDITVDELRVLLKRAGTVDDIYQSSSLRLVSNGTATPLIDLTTISDELADQSAGADFIALIGMGRGVESNWKTQFSCDCLRVCMLKDPHTAKSVGGNVFDAVMRFE